MILPSRFPRHFQRPLVKLAQQERVLPLNLSITIHSLSGNCAILSAAPLDGEEEAAGLHAAFGDALGGVGVERSLVLDGLGVADEIGDWWHVVGRGVEGLWTR